MNFLERMVRWMGGPEEEVAAVEEEQPQEIRKKGKLVAMDGRQRPVRVVVVELNRFDDVQTVVDHLKTRHPVIVSLNRADRDSARRMVDFLSGATYALEGGSQKVAEATFLFTPKGIEIDSNQYRDMVEDESFV